MSFEGKQTKSVVDSNLSKYKTVRSPKKSTTDLFDLTVAHSESATSFEVHAIFNFSAEMISIEKNSCQYFFDGFRFL